MDAKLKAKELVDKFYLGLFIEWVSNRKIEKQKAKECAMIVVDEILSAHFMKRDSGYKTFWLKVKKEIATL